MYQEVALTEIFGKKNNSKHIKGSKERLFIRTQTHNPQIFGVIPFVKQTIIYTFESVSIRLVNRVTNCVKSDVHYCGAAGRP